MKQEGVEFVLNAHIGVNKPVEELEKAFDAIVLCCGSTKPRNLQVPGREGKGVLFAVDYLTTATKKLLDPSVELPDEMKRKGQRRHRHRRRRYGYGLRRHRASAGLQLGSYNLKSCRNRALNARTTTPGRNIHACSRSITRRRKRSPNTARIPGIIFSAPGKSSRGAGGAVSKVVDRSDRMGEKRERAYGSQGC